MVDLGYGSSAATTLELHQRLCATRPDVEVVGIEIDPERVRAAVPFSRPGVSFRVGGFEVPLPRERRATIIRALNVLRQYDEATVLESWHRMVARLEPGGVLVEGTCNEVGRVASWVDVTPAGPRSLTISLRLADLTAPPANAQPSIVAERLPKALIHRNVEGEPVHAYLADLDRWWRVHSPLGVYAPSQRWVAVASSMREQGWPILGTKARWRLGELTVAWNAVAPRGFEWQGR